MKQTQLHLLLAAALCCAACTTKPETSIPSTPSAIRIEPTIATRVSGAAFDAEDRIGVSVYRQGGALFMDNRCFTYDGSNFTAADARWYPEADQVSTLVAYYPYNAAALPQQFTVASDQRGEALGQSDLLGACRSDVRPGREAVALTFHHLFALIDITVTTPATAQIERISVKGFTPAATVDLQALTATAGAADPTEITAHEATKNSRYSVILPPQRAGLELCVYSDRNDLTAKRLAEVELVGGKRYTLQVTLSAENLVEELVLTADIVDWTDGGALDDGDTQNTNGQELDSNDSTSVDPGPSGSVEHAGVRYATRKIGALEWMAENLRVVPAGAQVGQDCFYPDNLEGNAAKLGLLYTCATATGAGICPPGWRLPEIGELTSLAAEEALTGDAAFFTESGYMTLRDGANVYNSDKSYWISATPGTEGRQHYLQLPAGGGTPSDKELSATTIAASVRCVKAE